MPNGWTTKIVEPKVRRDALESRGACAVAGARHAYHSASGGNDYLHGKTGRNCSITPETQLVLVLVDWRHIAMHLQQHTSVQ